MNAQIATLPLQSKALNVLHRSLLITSSQQHKMKSKSSSLMTDSIISSNGTLRARIRQREETLLEDNNARDGKEDDDAVCVLPQANRATPKLGAIAAPNSSKSPSSCDEKEHESNSNNNSSPSLSPSPSLSSSITLMKIAHRLKHILLPVEYETLQKGDFEFDQNDSSSPNSKENDTVSYREDGDVASVPRRRKVAPLGTVPIYDNCTQLREKLEFLRHQFIALERKRIFSLVEQHDNDKLNQDNNDDDDGGSSSTTSTRFLLEQRLEKSSIVDICRAISIVSGRKIRSTQYKRFVFDKKNKGSFAGAESVVYADGYVFLEKLRIYNEVPKSMERLENEKKCDAFLPGLGFQRCDVTRKWN